jgi:uncharacterized membrane protein
MADSREDELKSIRAEQARLGERMAALQRRIDGLQSRPPPPAVPPVIPPPLPVEVPRVPEPSVVPPIPRRNPTLPPDRPEPPRRDQTPESKTDSLEVQLGTVWLVRIGIVVLLTGLVFLGNYAWQNVIARIGPLGKVICLYTIGAGLTAAGAFLGRGRKDLRNYARVLGAGGLAAIYYTTYAAHFVPKLRVIESPFIAGALLLAVAAGIVWIADRKRSETLALFAVLLSYYTAAMNPLTGFALFSGLLLTGAAVFFLVRHRWMRLTFAALIASYLSFAYWQFFQGTEIWRWASLTRADFWMGAGYLSGYWMVFTAAVFLGPPDRLARQNRLAFLSANNAAFFSLVTAMLVGVYPRSFWIFALGYGAILLGLALLANRRLRDDPWVDGGYLMQGLLLVSAGMVAKVTGYQLALVLAVESAALIACSSLRHGWIFRFIAGCCATVACWSALWQIEAHPAWRLPLGVAITLVLLFDARWLKHLSARSGFDLRAAWFVILALVVGGAVIWNESAPDDRAATFAVIAALLAWTSPFHGLIELALIGQVYFAVGASGEREGWIRPLLVLGSAVALNDWWFRQKELALREPARIAIRLLYVAVALLLLVGWTLEHLPEPWQFLFLIAAALALFVWALLAANPLRIGIAGVIAGIGSWLFLFDHEVAPRCSWPDLAAIILLLGAQQLGRRVSSRNAGGMEVAHRALITAGALCLWIFVTRKVNLAGGGFYMTVAWSALGAVLFAAGLALREAVHRYAGFVILGCALGRLVFVDVMRLDSLARMVSFLVLGVVLLGLGFVYNKHAAKFREWL